MPFQHFFNLQVLNESQKVPVPEAKRAKKTRLRPCDGCKKRRTKCELSAADSICHECHKREIPCSFSVHNMPTSCDSCIHRRLRCVSSEGSSSCTHCMENGWFCRYSEVLDHSSESTINSRICVNLDKHLIQDLPGLYRRVDSDIFFQATMDSPELVKSKQESLSRIRSLVGSHMQEILDCYWRYVHPIIPVFIRSNVDINDPLLLCTVVLHGLNYLQYDSVQNKMQKECITMLQTILRHDFQSVKVSHVQSLILLMNYPFPPEMERTLNRPLMISVMLNIVEDLGLNISCETWDLSAEEKRQRKMLAWCVISLDKFYALFTLKCSKIQPNMYVLSELTPSDFDSQQEGQSIFISVVTLSYHCNDVLNELYNWRSFSYDTIEEVLVKAYHLLGNLDAWYGSFLSSQQTYYVNVTIGSVQLLYFFLETMIFRRVIDMYLSSQNKLVVVTFIKDKILPNFQKLEDFLSGISDMQMKMCWYKSTFESFISISIIFKLLLKTDLELPEEVLHDVKKYYIFYKKKLQYMSKHGLKNHVAYTLTFLEEHYQGI